MLQGLDNCACNLFVLVHTTPPFSRDFGAFRQRLLLDLTACVHKHGAQLVTPRQVSLCDGAVGEHMQVLKGYVAYYHLACFGAFSWHMAEDNIRRACCAGCTMTRQT